MSSDKPDKDFRVLAERGGETFKLNLPCLSNISNKSFSRSPSVQPTELSADESGYSWLQSSTIRKLVLLALLVLNLLAPFLALVIVYMVRWQWQKKFYVCRAKSNLSFFSPDSTTASF